MHNDLWRKEVDIQVKFRGFILPLSVAVQIVLHLLLLCFNHLIKHLLVKGAFANLSLDLRRGSFYHRTVVLSLDLEDAGCEFHHSLSKLKVCVDIEGAICVEFKSLVAYCPWCLWVHLKLDLEHIQGQGLKNKPSLIFAGCLREQWLVSLVLST